MQWKNILILEFLVLIAIITSINAEQLCEAKVKEVMSGDTMILDSGEIVKLMGIAIPTDFPEAKKEFFKKGAKELCEQLIKDNSRSIKLEYNEKKRDEYNNILAYVYIDKMFLNAELIRRGFFVLSVDFSDERYLETFRSMEAEAKEQKRGIWADLDERMEKYTGAVVGNKKSRKYHKYDCKYVLLLSDSNKKKFKNQDEAVSAGYSPCNHCRPDKTIVNFVPAERRKE